MFGFINRVYSSERIEKLKLETSAFESLNSVDNTKHELKDARHLI